MPRILNARHVLVVMSTERPWLPQGSQVPFPFSHPHLLFRYHYKQKPKKQACGYKAKIFIDDFGKACYNFIYL